MTLRDDLTTAGMKPFDPPWGTALLAFFDEVALDGTDLSVGGTFHIDTTAQRVGVGTTSPQAPLAVVGETRLGRNTAQYVRIDGDATKNTVAGVSQSGNAKAFIVEADENSTSLQLKTLTPSPIIFAVNDVEALRVDDNGKVGVGETIPNYYLDVDGTFGFTPGASVTPVDNGDVVIEATSNTTLTFKLRGSDGVVRSGTVTLS